MIDLARDTIFLTIAGSHAHGTAHAGSDVDLRGICVAPFRTRVSYIAEFEQFEGELDGALWEEVLPRVRQHRSASSALSSKVECVVFDIAKLIRLAAGANPNALEILFAHEDDWLLARPTWQSLHAERHQFLSQKVQETYLGYALAQLKRIRTHRSWLLNPPKQRPERKEFGLPESSTLSHDDRNRIEQAVADRMREVGLEDLDMPRATRLELRERLQRFWLEALGVSEERLADDMHDAAARALGVPPGVIQTLGAEKRYRAAMKHWDAYQTWKAQRNPARAQLEARFGYDTKHAMHLVRLMRTGLELLETADLSVRRGDWDELSRIRDGVLTYDEVVAEAEQLRERMQVAAKRTALRPDVDHQALDALLGEILERSVRDQVPEPPQSS